MLGREPLALEAILPMIGDGARALVGRALAADYEGPDETLLDQTQALFLDAYAQRACVHTTLLPGALEAIAIDVPRAIVTNKPRQLTLLVLEGLGIASAFQAVRAGGDGPMKPAPDGVLAIVQVLGVLIEHVWFVGDGPQDILAGHAAGCFTIAVPGIAEREQVLAAKPDLIVDSLLDVARLAARHIAARGPTLA